MIRIKKGLDLPITGEPRQSIDSGPAVRTVALVGADYIGMKPKMAVREGDRVKLGQLLFTDKKTAGVRYTSPGAGVVTAINRGAKRRFESLVVELEGEEEVRFAAYDDVNPASLTRQSVLENLLESGLWTAIRKRPFSRVPSPQDVPHSIFVTATDTNPFAAQPEIIIAEREAEFVTGLKVISRLTEGPTFLCKADGVALPGGDLAEIQTESFAGPHPAGLAGTHIHFLDPVSETKSVWYVGYQDVIAIGHLFLRGALATSRVISLAGPVVNNPRLIRTRLGACVTDLVDGEISNGNNRVISGSVLSGRMVRDHIAYLGRYHSQISVLHEGTKRIFLGWQRLGFDKFSVKHVFASMFYPDKRFPFTTSTEGSRRAMVPVGSYEQVVPLDILPTFLLRALIVGDSEEAQALGCLELDEEDLALCTFVCPGKYDYGPILRENLTRIELEG